ncbi:hypothetical protein [Clostridium rectalis]|uniref:hypothetical protein n=1 Tax=Clostridium rectalis TaxID=2040295 RepID=UPI000F6375EB|nr:hypothetical protein [Clostridium rectalis]
MIIRKQFLEDGVKPATIEKLINKIKNGETLDAENPDKIAQVPKGFFKFELKDSTEKSIQEKTYTFEDGSYIKVESIPTKRIKIIEPLTRSVEYSHYGAIYTDEFIKTTYGSSKVVFYCIFRMLNQSRSVINNVYGTTGWGLGSWTYGEPQLIRSTQNGSMPAFAVATCTQTTGMGDLSKTMVFSCEFKVYEHYYTMELIRRN